MAAKKTMAAASSFAEPSMYPLHRCKIIHVVRHGQGFHNVAGDIDRKNYESWDYQDASLTELGWQQADALHQHLVTTHIRAHVELVVVSPLLRTLQTAVGVWGGDTLLDGEPTHSALMIKGVGLYRHAPISSSGAPPFIANEWIREQNGVHPCDKRASISSYKQQFPAINFGDVETDEDTWWKPTVRETAEEIWTRARVFMKWLLERSERRIAVVSHSSFIYHLLHLFGDDCSDVVRRELLQGFRNCEMRSFVICDRRATGKSKAYNTDFAGGIYFCKKPEAQDPVKPAAASAASRRSSKSRSNIKPEVVVKKLMIKGPTSKQLLLVDAHEQPKFVPEAHDDAEYNHFSRALVPVRSRPVPELGDCSKPLSFCGDVGSDASTEEGPPPLYLT